MKKEKILDYTIITIFVLMLFFISDALKISIITQPKLFGLVIGVIIVLLLCLKKVSLKNKNKKTLEYVYVTFLLALAFITLVTCLLNNKVQLTYLFEIIRPVIYASIVLIFSYLFKKESNKNFFNRILYIIIPFSLIFGIIQFYNIGNINSFYIKTIAPSQYSTLINNYAYPRIVGLLSNPNEYGFILAMINIYLFYLMMENINNKKNVIILITLILMNRITLYLTGSRTSFIVAIFSELLFIFLYLIFKSKPKKIKSIFKSTFKSGMICLTILGVEAAILFSLPNMYTWRVKSLFIGNIDSWEIRKDKNSQFVKDLLENNSEDKSDKKDNDITQNNNNEKNETKTTKKDNKVISLIIGHGPQKKGALYDNEYFRIFDSYGILGTAVFLAMFIIPLFFIKNYNLIFITYYIAIISLNFIYVFAAGNYFSYNLFSSLLLFIFLGFIGDKNEK